MNKTILLEKLVLKKVENYSFEPEVINKQTKLTDFGFKNAKPKPNLPNSQNLFKYGFKKNPQK